jgi:hypothetical protein
VKLPVTYCSSKKRDGVLPPDKLYNSRRIENFVRYCKESNLAWAILSAKYGLFFPEEKRWPYNVTLKSDGRCWLGIRVNVNGKELPNSESNLWLEDLAQTVKTQADKYFVEQITFYTWSLKQPKCYLTLLHFVIDNCRNPHPWSELLECIKRYGRIDVATQLDFDH